jgi:hypothetical protein
MMGKPINGRNGASVIPGGSQDPFITVTSGLSGFFAVCFWWNPEGFWEPWDTHPARRATVADAEADAKAWSIEDNIEYRQPHAERFP